MKQGKIWLLPLLAAALLAGCGGEEQQESAANTESGPETSEEGPEAAEDLEERIKALEVRTWQDIAGESISPEEAMRNSGRENFEYLTWSGEGEAIYYTDFAAGKIYACTAEGEEKTCLYESPGWQLAVKDGWLYAGIEDGGRKIVRINCETGESEEVFAEPCGEFFFLQDELYIITEDGFCVLGEDGERTYCGQEFEVANVQLCQDMILANAINGLDPSFFMKGYLLGYDTAEKRYFRVKENALWPVAAGDRLSYFDLGTNTRHILDRATGTDTDWGVHAQYVAYDGTSLYYQDKDTIIYCWDGRETTALVTDAGSVQYFYLTPTHLYWLQSDSTWRYCDLESGESGEL